MKKKYFLLKLGILWSCFGLLACTGLAKNQASVDGFIKHMASKHQFKDAELADLFAKVEIKADIVERISKPSEALPWYKYRKIFLKQPRIKAGVKFWQEHAKTLAKVEQETGVPAAIIVAIIGVETMYGQHTGNFRVIDALSTLAFAYPPRSPFFSKELEEFLLLCREGQMDPLAPTGSYAGAMGMPQFMPSSYRIYAVDFDKDKRRDIWGNPDDVIASIGQYFVKHGWKTGQPVAFQVCDCCHKPVKLFPFLKENLSLIKCNSENPNISTPLLSTKKAKIVAFELENGEELWATSDNFYVITRYNHSPLYAMAVYQLSLAISNLRDSPAYEKNHSPIGYSGALWLFQPAYRPWRSPTPNPTDLPGSLNTQGKPDAPNRGEVRR